METRGRGANKHGSEKCSSNQPGKDTGNQSTVTSTPKQARPDSQLSTIDDLKGKMGPIHSDLWDDRSGVHNKIKSVSDQIQCNYEEISSLRAENAQLRREFDLLRSVVIRMDRRMSVLDADITDL